MSADAFSPKDPHVALEPLGQAVPVRGRTLAELRELAGTVTFYAVLGIGVFTPLVLALYGFLFR